MLRKQAPRPLKRLGQNFLVSKNVLKRIVDAAQLESDDTVLEIGPGTGFLTRELAAKAKKVIAVEKDPRMLAVLAESLQNFKNVAVVRGDVLKLKLQLPQSYKVVGNLPFYITAPAIRMFLEAAKVKPQLMVLVVQKEVGQRICAKPPRMSLLSTAVQFYADAELLFNINKKSFWPRPKVDAAVIKITPHPPLIGDDGTFFKIVKAGFSQPRKQLINNLSKNLKIDKMEMRGFLLENGLKPEQRAESLSLRDWINLSEKLKTK